MAKIARLSVPEDATFPGPGMCYFENKGNGFTVFVCHDTADPDKRSSEWRHATQQGYTDQRIFEQEHDLSFESWGGKPVFLSFSRAEHVAAGRLQYQPTALMQRWWDLGHHACVWAQVYEGRLSLFDSRQTIGAFGPEVVDYRPWEIEVSGLGQFIERCLEISREVYPQAESWRDIIDPAGKNPDVTHQTTATRVFQDHGLRPLLGDTQDIIVRINDVEDWLATRPGMIIDPHAKVLVDGFAGGYKYLRDGVSEKPDNQSGYGHCQCAIQYGCGKNRALNTKRQHEQDIQRNLDPARHDLTYQRRERRRSSHWLGY